MGRLTPLCHTCQQKVSKKGDQGLTCGSCNRSDHFKCLRLTEEKKSAILLGDQCYLCVSCKNKQRLSLSLVADTPPKVKKVSKPPSGSAPDQSSTSVSNTKAGPPKAKVSPTEEKTSSANDDLISSLLATIQTLTETVKKLEAKLEQAFNHQNHRQKNTTKAKPLTDRRVSFTINGVPEKKYKDPREIVEKVIKATDHSLELDSTTVVKKLTSKSNSRTPVILVSVKPDSTNLATLKQLKRRKLTGQDIDIPNCEQIFVNESYPSQVYKLLKEAKKLKQHGYRFVWVQNNRVLARVEEKSPVIQIKDADHLNSVIAATSDEQNASEQ